MKKPSVALYLLVAALLCLVMGVNARADQIIASSTGLTTPTQTLTFDEIVLPMNASLTNQYAGLGVSFSPNAFYSPQTNYGNVQGNDIGNFTFSGGGPISPITIIFSSALNGAAFSFDADVTPYLFQAELGGVVVDSFTATVGAGSTSDFYGFANENFDSIVITQTSSGGGPFWVADNLEFGSVASATATPEPGTMPLLGIGVLGLAALKLMKK